MPYFHPYVQWTCMSFVILVHIYPSKTTIDASLWHIHQIIVAPGHQDWSWLHYAACHHIHEWCHSLRAEDALIVITGVRWGGDVTGHWGIMPHDDLIYLLRYFTQGLCSFILRFIHSYIEIIKDLWKCLGLEYNPKFLYKAIAR